MKKIMLTAAIAALAMGAIAQTNNMDNNYENYIQVTGKAEREVTPDRIYLRIEINEADLKSRQTLEQMEQQMIAALRGIGIDTDTDLKIGGMSSQWQKYVLRRNAARTSGVYELKVDGAQTMGRVFQALEAVGISRITIARLDHSQMKQIQDEVRIEAMKNAQQTAQAIAGAVGQSAGRAVYVVDYNQDVTPIMLRMDMAMTKAAGNTDEYYETELDFKDMKVVYNLTVKFELK